jgi:DNA replication protein DnaC
LRSTPASCCSDRPSAEGHKTHIAVSLAVVAIQAAYTVLYISAFDLAQDMTEALATGVRRELVRLDANRPARA